MTPGEMAAYIGAAAWLPQIGRWIYTATTAPKFKVISGPTVGIAHMFISPVVELSVAISCERRDGIIKEMTLNARHEKGEERQLRWSWLRETAFQMSAPTGESMEFGKNQPPIALKVATVSLSEKQIMFDDPECSARAWKITLNLLEQYNYLKKSEPNPEDTLRKSKEFMEAQAFFIESMYWKEGRYRFEVVIQAVKLRKPYRERFEVVLYKSDIDSLRGNFNLFESHVHAFLASKGAIAERAAWPMWKWTFPNIRPVS